MKKKGKFEQQNGENNFSVIFKVCFTKYLLSFNIIISKLCLSKTLERRPKLNES